MVDTADRLVVRAISEVGERDLDLLPTGEVVGERGGPQLGGLAVRAAVLDLECDLLAVVLTVPPEPDALVGGPVVGRLICGEVVGEAAVAADLVGTGEDLGALGASARSLSRRAGGSSVSPPQVKMPSAGWFANGTSPSKRSTGTGAGSSAPDADPAAVSGSSAVSRVAEASRAVLRMDLPLALVVPNVSLRLRSRRELTGAPGRRQDFTPEQYRPESLGIKGVVPSETERAPLDAPLRRHLLTPRTPPSPTPEGRRTMRRPLRAVHVLLAGC